MGSNKHSFFDYTHENQVGENEFETIVEYSANITINDNFILQISGKSNEAFDPEIPESHMNLCKLAKQDFACDNYDANEIWNYLQDHCDFENNFDFLKDHSLSVTFDEL